VPALVVPVRLGLLVEGGLGALVLGELGLGATERVELGPQRAVDPELLMSVPPSEGESGFAVVGRDVGDLHPASDRVEVLDPLGCRPTEEVTDSEAGEDDDGHGGLDGDRGV
jgi:hypothetical protein